MSSVKFYGTNLDANMVVNVSDEIEKGSVLRIVSDLFDGTEEFYKVKGIELNKEWDNGRKAKFDWEKDKLNLQLVKGIQKLNVVRNNESDIEYVTEFGIFYFDVSLKKNQPVMIGTELYTILDLEKTGKRSAEVTLELNTDVVIGHHHYKDIRFNATDMEFELRGMSETFGGYLKLKRNLD